MADVSMTINAVCHYVDRCCLLFSGKELMNCRLCGSSLLIKVIAKVGYFFVFCQVRLKPRVIFGCECVFYVLADQFTNR